jgi:hypothetical protein
LFSDPFIQRKVPQRYVIPHGTDSAYHSYEDPMADSAALFAGNGMPYLADGNMTMDYTDTGVLGADFLGQGMQDMSAGMGYNQQYPPHLADEDLQF